MSDDYAPASRIELNIDWQVRLEYKPKLISRGREPGHFCDRTPPKLVRAVWLVAAL